MIKFEIYEISLAIFLIVCFLINLPLDFTLFVHTVINVLVHVLGAGFCSLSYYNL